MKDFEELASEEGLEREVKGLWIPIDFWQNKELTILEKCLLAEIDSLDKKGKGCFASNDYLGSFLGVSNKTIANLLVKLRKSGYITDVGFDGRKRYLSLAKTSEKNITVGKADFPNAGSYLPECGILPSRIRESRLPESGNIYNSNIKKNINTPYKSPTGDLTGGLTETSPILSETEPIKPEKKTKKKRDYPPEENKQINELMDLFRKTNPTLKFSRLDHRDACHELIEKFGFDEAKVMCSYAISLSGKQYAPVITTPSKMVDKLADLGAYIQRNGGAISGKIAYENRLSVEKEEEDLLKKYKDSLPRSLKPWHGELKATEENLQEMIAMFRENGVEPTSSRAGDIIILATEGLNTTIPGVISGFKEKKDQIFKTIAEWEEQRAKQAEKDRMIEKSIAEGTYKTTYTR